MQRRNWMYKKYIYIYVYVFAEEYQRWYKMKKYKFSWDETHRSKTVKPIISILFFYSSFPSFFSFSKITFIDLNVTVWLFLHHLPNCYSLKQCWSLVSTITFSMYLNFFIFFCFTPIGLCQALIHFTYEKAFKC